MIKFIVAGLWICAVTIGAVIYSFQVAGARTLIMSLWRVEDESTREWMLQLYGEHSKGQLTAEAVRNASLNVLKARRAKGKSTHPFYWGAFVAAGDWR